MVLAFILMGLILLATPYAYKMLGIATPPPSTDAGKKADNTRKIVINPEQQKAATTASGAPMALATADSATPPSSVIAATAEEDRVIDTDAYHVVFSNRGAVVKSWTLKNYKDSAGKPLELVNQIGASKVGFPFSFAFRDKQPGADLNKALWVAHPEGIEMRFEYSDGQTVASKTFAFQRDATLVQYSDSVTSNGAAFRTSSSGAAVSATWRSRMRPASNLPSATTPTNRN